MRVAFACVVMLGCGGGAASAIDAPAGTDAPQPTDGSAAIVLPPPNAAYVYAGC